MTTIDDFRIRIGKKINEALDRDIMALFDFYQGIVTLDSGDYRVVGDDTVKAIAVPEKGDHD